MAIILFNPTNEDFQAQYGGSSFTIPAFPKDGHMVRVDDNKANHVLNQLGPRGLTSLDYEDGVDKEKKEKKAIDGKRRNLDFKRTQIARYNRDNEGRKARQLEYVEPPKHIIEYAKELGVGLIQPYELADIKNEEISQLKAENERRNKENDDLRKQIKDLIALVHDKIIPKTPEEVEAELIETTIDEIKRMNRQMLNLWVKGLGQEKYGEFPLAVQSFILKRWEGFFDDKKEEMPFPY